MKSDYRKFYRIPSYFRLPPGLTALDIIEFEENELYNAGILYSPINRDWLRMIPARKILWLTKTVKAVLRYDTRANIEKYSLKKGSYQIVGEDGDGGFLVVID